MAAVVDLADSCEETLPPEHVADLELDWLIESLEDVFHLFLVGYLLMDKGLVDAVRTFLPCSPHFILHFV